MIANLSAPPSPSSTLMRSIIHWYSHYSSHEILPFRKNRMRSVLEVSSVCVSAAQDVMGI